MQETWVQSLNWEDSLKEGMATKLKLIIYLKNSAPVKKTIFFFLRKKMIGKNNNFISVWKIGSLLLSSSYTLKPLLLLFSCTTRVWLFVIPWTVACLAPLSRNTGAGCHFFLQEIFPTQGLNWGLLHWQVDSLPLSKQGSPIVVYNKKRMFGLWFLAQSS